MRIRNIKFCIEVKKENNLRIERFLAVRGGHHDNAFSFFETVQFRQQLKMKILSIDLNHYFKTYLIDNLIIILMNASHSLAADRIDFVDENDAR